MLHLRRIATACLVAAVACIPARARAQQTHHDVLRGTVTTDSGTVIAGADVIATMAPDRLSRSVKTDAEGRYSIAFEQGTGDYLLHVSAPGRQTFRKRIIRAGTDSVFVTDVKLASAAAVQQLSAVNVNARKPKPQRDRSGFASEAGAAEKVADGVNGAVPPDLAGNLDAIAGTIPGIAVTPGGISIAGSSPTQNSTTINGMAFGGADVPRDARTTTRVSSSSFDPARGWFAGVNTDVGLSSGNIFANRQAHLTLDAPPLQYTDPVSSRLGQRFTGIRASMGGDGAFNQDRLAYNYGLDASRRSSDFVSLGTAPAGLLQIAGVSADSAARLGDLLTAAGIPRSVRAVPSSRVSQSASLIGRIDRAPYDWNTFTPARTTIGLLGYAKVGTSDAVGITPTGTAAHGGSTSQQIGMLQALYSTYFHDDYLTEARSSLSVSHNSGSPYLRLPDGRVLVGSTFDDGTGGLTSLAFGGNGALSSDSRRWTWETISETQFYAQGKQTHRVKLTGDARFDGVHETLSGNQLGAFSYNSLADLAANRPASFTRTLGAPVRTGQVWNGFVALGDLWRKSDAFQIMYGARVEGNRYTAAPAYNPAVDAVFGVRTDHAPNTMHVSPRAGFTWVRSGNGRNGASIRVSPIGRFIGSPTSYIRGGIGEFRSFLGPDLLTGASVATGLPNGVTSLQCVGAATPTPDWNAYGANEQAIPQTCANGAPSTLTDAAPPVQAFDRAYTAPRSWRGNLSYGSSFHHFVYSVEGLYSLNMNQPGRTDLNFANAPRFTLSDEGRPVYVSPGSIVPATGALSTVEARKSALFGHVVDNVSNLGSVGRQLTLTVTPDFSNGGGMFGPGGLYMSFGYTLGSNRARSSGFDGSTFDSPVARSWARGDLDIRHQFLVQGGFVVKHVAVTLFGRLQSGTPFTPMVGGDVNGDGYANDRAFVFDPAHTTDAALGSATRALLSGASGNVRDCLTRQLGRAADRNSCEGPWTAALNAQLSLRRKVPGTDHYGTVALALVNPLGGLDQLLHGSNNLHGWGTPAAPDPILYSPRGFDAAAGRFNYTVNPRFGSTSPSSNVFRSPFRVTLDVQMDLGPSIPVQQINRWLRPGRTMPGPKLSAPELKRRYARNVPDPYAQILQESDSLLLTRDQVEGVQKIQAQYRQRVDSLWTSLSSYLANLGDTYDAKEALKTQETATDAAWELTRQDVQKMLPTVLSPIQLKLLPGMANMLYTAKEPLHIRIFMAGS